MLKLRIPRTIAQQLLKRLIMETSHILIVDAYQCAGRKFSGEFEPASQIALIAVTCLKDLQSQDSNLVEKSRTPIGESTGLPREELMPPTAGPGICNWGSHVLYAGALCWRQPSLIDQAMVGLNSIAC